MKQYFEYSDYIKNMIEITDKKALHKALCDHFAYLADSPGYEKILCELMKDAHKVEIDGGDLVVQFRGSKALYAGPPAEEKQLKSFPDSYKKCAVIHKDLSFHEKGSPLHFGHPGNFEEEYLEDAKSDLLSIIKAKDVLCPISDYSDWWIYHPEQKTPQNEPGLCFFSHEGGDLEPAEMIPVGSLFLKRMAQIEEIEIEFPEPVDVDQDPMIWWKGLNENWQRALYKAADIKDGEKADEEIINKIIKLKKFTFHENDSDLQDLKPLSMLKKLNRLNLSRQTSITNLEPLSTLKNMYYISISGSPINNLSPLSGLKHLEFLDFDQAPISNIRPVSELNNLKRLELIGSKVTDLSPLKGLMKLEKLNISGCQIENLETLPTLIELSSLDISSTKISDISPLKQFPGLGDIDISKTAIKDLSPLDKLGNIFIFTCNQSEISFKELLRFLSSRYEKVISDDDDLDIYCDYMSDPQIFTDQLASLDKLPKGSEDISSFWVNQFVIYYYKQKEYEAAANLLKIFLKHKPFKLNSGAAQDFISNSIPLLMVIEDPKLEKELISLLPESLTLSTLAFNFSCMYAKRNNKNDMLIYMEKALKLNQDPQTFKSDSDFHDFQKDPDFLAILTGPKSIDPRVDPAGWWNPLDEEWKDLLYDEAGGIDKREDIVKVLNLKELRVWEPVTLEPLRYLTGLKKLKIEHSKTSDLEPLSGLTGLEELSLLRSTIDKVSFKDISPLAELKNLKLLNIAEQQISDLSALRKMNMLEWLRLVRLPTDSIDFLTGTKDLKHVEIQLMKISDIKSLKENHAIEDLTFYSTDVNDISILENMIELKKLHLSGSQVSDIEVLGKCKKLKTLQLSGCPVKTLIDLENLPVLKEIGIYDSLVSKEEIEAFKERHPECEVD